MAVTSSVVALSQNITEAEYFVDVDLGVGNNTPISIINGTIIDENFSVPARPAGSYTLYVRTKDANGVWGFTEARPFIVKDNIGVITPPPADINKLEYFVDNDPGHGLGINLTITQGAVVDIPFNTATLTEGYHTIGTRARNTDNSWGFYEVRQVIVKSNIGIGSPIVYDVTEIEYFFDDDPGVGLATKWPAFSQGSPIDLAESLPEASSLSSGQHVLVSRAKNANGVWGFYERRQIIIKENFIATPSLSPITKMEFYIDGNDPGVGNATDIPITPNTLIDLNTVDVAPSGTLIDGQHTFTIRAMNQDGIWGLPETSTFDVLDDCNQPVVAVNPQLGCAQQQVTFVDASTNIQPDAQYRWYLDGDNIVDNTTVGDVTFTYAQPGTYIVALAISQGTICYDSLSTTITIKPLPAVAISATGNLTNQPTAFEASTVNLDPAATWSWDFDSDGTPESSNPTTASYTYTADGGYTASLTVSDGFGCNVTSTKSVTMSSDGAAPPPSVDFLVSDGCAGEPIQFTDLSRNLPTGSTYSWDFDGDGTEDSTTPGLVQFIYTTSSTYTATLTIDIGGSTLQASKIVDVLEVPSVDFSSVKTCAGQATNFTDLSTGISGSAVYMWDFDNDGSVDSNASTAISFVYPAAGNYIARLTINNGAGCQRSIVKQVEVAGAPSTAFSNSISCTDETVAFVDLSSLVNAGATYSWDFDGDGLEDDDVIGDPVFTYSTAGIYDATLTVTNDPGCADVFTKQIIVIDRPRVDIEVIAKCYLQESLMNDFSTNVVVDAEYSWDFNNDGLVDDQTQGSTSFTYQSFNSYVVNLMVDNGGGCFAEAEELVVFSDAALPDFKFSTTCEDEEVIFTDLSDLLEIGATYEWDFDGNGFVDSEFPGSTNFTYTEAGVYYPKLTIDNGGGCLADKIDTLEVTGPPIVTLGPDVFLCNDSTVVLDAGEGYSSYFWFDDLSTEQTYTIEQVGEYVVSVTDAKSCQNSDTVRVGYLGDPTPSFEYTYQLSADGMIVNFSNTSINGSTYRWDYGDATPPVFEENPIHLFDEFFFYKNTFYDVCLTAINACDRPVEYCQTISLSPTELEGDIGKTKIYPNPAKDILSIDFDEIPLRAQLFDAKGRSVWSKDAPDPFTEIRVSEWQAGIYILTLVKEDGLFYRNVVIQ